MWPWRKQKTEPNRKNPRVILEHDGKGVGVAFEWDNPSSPEEEEELVRRLTLMLATVVSGSVNDEIKNALLVYGSILNSPEIARRAVDCMTRVLSEYDRQSAVSAVPRPRQVFSHD